ncbi:pyridoxamine 5'-phosphate oxidase (plasmid) [Pseudosulfitobacter pseudonitzschiae]|uniref:Pyridoxamine 5'-phosphate oxidase n=1 Tax=Pseudosulfitobacter pseudonitzschiae TaxID=1402135 RepID=A0A221K9D6_9RHOB|nr:MULTISPECIES: pyridoxamine 5'-phosphate oxidase family protein [Roseobacteraceae]ASM75463.1 pyridoxamine 5'-phosphate oxidase [Pseudosulfitobacter pseudonitzschiae]
MNHPATFHAGEIAVQDRAGVPPRTREMASRAMRDAMPAQHQEFFESLPLVFLALLDRRGRPWAVPVSGTPGFARALSPKRLSLSHTPDLAEDFDLDTGPGASVGLIGIDLATRRRNRMNGQTASGGEGLEIAVEQSFGNCPKYIQTRAFELSRTDPPLPVRRQMPLKSDAVRSIIAGADTFFIASRGARVARNATEGLDVSHRGGRPGFLGINEDGTLSFPDFSGNRYFNTLGNIEADGRAGLLVPDFASGDALCLTGRAAVDWTSGRATAFAGAERIVDFVPDEIWHVEHALPATARLIEVWPDLNQTGRWQDAHPTRA